MRIFLIGATGGIGSATAKRLRNAGADVILAGRKQETLAALGIALDSPYVVVDATDFDALDQAVQNVGPLDGLINCAGSLLLKPAHITTANEYARRNI